MQNKILTALLLLISFKIHAQLKLNNEVYLDIKKTHKDDYRERGDNGCKGGCRYYISIYYKNNSDTIIIKKIWGKQNTYCQDFSNDNILNNVSYAIEINTLTNQYLNLSLENAIVKLYKNTCKPKAPFLFKGEILVQYCTIKNPKLNYVTIKKIPTNLMRIERHPHDRLIRK